jgi:hypothetical protein
MTENKTTIADVREVLMSTLRDLRSRDNPMELDRARTVAQVATVLVDTARVENDYLKLTGQDRSEFLESKPEDMPAIPNTTGPSAHNPFPVSARHRLVG